MNTQPFYPIGLQNFAEIRERKAVYVDKTDLVHKMVYDNKFMFLSRPRRFGKTLLTSTLQHYFEGHRELFTGLAMERLETEWTQHPVLRFDLSVAKSNAVENVLDGISRQIRKYEAVYGKDDDSRSLSSRMADLIERANAQTGRGVVVLIDEYDAPLLEVMHDDEKREKIRNLLREFYSPLKMCDDSLRFVFLTGISMFSQLSIFSELNNLEIISQSCDYATICGITERELRDNFQCGLEAMAKEFNCSTDEILSKLRDTYDGYHFCANSVGVFNPFSLLNAFKQNTLGSYWFGSGTPISLIKSLERFKREGKFKIEMLDSPKPVSLSRMETPIEMQTGPIPLLYQAGYLTIKGYDRDTSQYILGIPNSEVRMGLMQNLLPLYAEVDSDEVDTTTANASAAFRRGDVDAAMRLFQSMLASVPFMKGDKEILADAQKTEAHYHILFYFFFRMLHNEVYAEVRNAVGASDVVIKTSKYIYVVEIKIDSGADAALKQIEERGYATPYLTDGREIIKLGVNFSTKTRTISGWRRG